MSKVEEPQAQYQPQPQPEKVSLEAYLEMIADGTRRLEYHDGVVVDIKSATVAHGRICTNLTSLIDHCLLEKDCDVYAGDRETWVDACNKMFYPDLLIVCGQHELKQMSKKVSATVNPSVVIEVLSESTEKYDIYEKSRCYKKLKSLKQIIFVAQIEKYIRVLNRTENDRLWSEFEAFDDEDIIKIDDCEILLKDIYRRVVFENNPQPSSDF